MCHKHTHPRDTRKRLSCAFSSELVDERLLRSPSPTYARRTTDGDRLLKDPSFSFIS